MYAASDSLPFAISHPHFVQYGLNVVAFALPVDFSRITKLRGTTNHCSPPPVFFFSDRFINPRSFLLNSVLDFILIIIRTIIAYRYLFSTYRYDKPKTSKTCTTRASSVPSSVPSSVRQTLASWVCNEVAAMLVLLETFLVTLYTCCNMQVYPYPLHFSSNEHNAFVPCSVCC